MNDLSTPPTTQAPVAAAPSPARRATRRRSREEAQVQALDSPEVTSSEELLVSLASARHLRLENSRAARLAAQRAAAAAASAEARALSLSPMTAMSPPSPDAQQEEAEAEAPALDMDRWLGIAARTASGRSSTSPSPSGANGKDPEAELIQARLLEAGLCGLRAELQWVACSQWRYAKQQ